MRLSSLFLILFFIQLSFYSEAKTEASFSGDYQILSNDCLSSLKINNELKILADDKGIQIETDETSFFFLAGNSYEGGEPEIYRKGEFDQEGQFEYIEKMVSSAGTEVDFNIFMLKRINQEVQILFGHSFLAGKLKACGLKLKS